MTEEAAKHTPGPWHLKMYPPNDWSPVEYPDALVRPDGKRVVFACVTNTTARDGEPLANTRLIAAAPDMLAALKDCADDLEAMVEHFYRDTKDHPAMTPKYELDMGPVRVARAIIAKAEGRS